jgi:hypothetical protein
MSRHPVFVVGSPRSGTSILVDGLLSTGYHGFREGMFLSIAHYFDQLIERQFALFSGDKNLISAIDKESLRNKIFACLKETTDQLNPAAPWFDKTGNPDMIHAIPILIKLWPDSVFIFAKRRAIENVLSRLKKFPQHNFEYHCSDWAKNMSAWRQMRVRMPASKFVEVDQYELIENAARVADRLRDLLCLNEGQTAEMLKTFRSNRPQQTEEGSAERVHTIKSAGFTDAQIAVFLKHCKTEMDAFGYTFDETYRGGFREQGGRDASIELLLKS